MIATCPKCQARMKVPVEKMTTETAKVRCPGCGICLKVRKPAPATPSAPAAPPVSSAPSTPTPKETEPEITFCDPHSPAEPIKPPSDAPEVKHKTGVALRTPEPPEANECAAPMGAKKRQFTRYAFKKKILVDKSIMIDGIDISEGGLFVHTGRSFVVGSVVSVALPLPGGDLTVRASVQHDTPGVGMGLQFVDMTAEQKQRLHAFFKAEMTAAEAASLEKKKQILFIGGNETARRIAKSKLTLEGFLVFEATTTVEALRKLVNPIPDVVLIDWQDVAIDCTEVLGKIKKDPLCRNIIKVVLTAVSNQEVQEKISEAGADVVLAKMDTPPVKLAGRIKEILESRE